ncbi:MAG: hypothetical protein AAF614_14935 [Chloroflexota bacterium]
MKNKRLRNILITVGAIAIAAVGYFTLYTPAEFRAQANPAPACKTAVFDKSALVFDSLLICGTSEVTADKLTHAANVAAEWLDNDEDGQVDEPRLLEAFGQTKPVLLMSGRGISPAVMPRIMAAHPDQRVQDLYASETNPGSGQRDASQEEIHHIIMNAGWQTLFPAVFSEQASDNSTLYQAWKTADSNRQYVYNDPTCDDSCKVTEFVYLATAAYMETGAELDLASDEMRLKTRAELANAIPSVIDIFESTDYVYPTNHWPDGTYPQQDNIVFFGIE